MCDSPVDIVLPIVSQAGGEPFDRDHSSDASSPRQPYLPIVTLIQLEVLRSPLSIPDPLENILTAETELRLLLYQSILIAMA